MYGAIFPLALFSLLVLLISMSGQSEYSKYSQLSLIFQNGDFCNPLLSHSFWKFQMFWDVVQILG